jgi:hypothetical protein
LRVRNSRYDPALQPGSGDELLLRAPQGQHHPLALSLFRPHSAASSTGRGNTLIF